METKQPKVFVKTAHLFAHRKQGVQKRFEKMYADLALKVKIAWTADLMHIETEMKTVGKYNQALQATKTDRIKEQAEKTARETLSTVFKEWRTEINRVVDELRGYPQENGVILFPDGSVARMPKGLWIPQEIQVKF